MNEKCGTIFECIAELSEEAVFLVEHLFIAKWQRVQFRQIRESIPKDWLITLADFAKKLQDEIQSAFYHHEQATIHPKMAYYKCPVCNTSNVEESIIFITSDLKHGAHAVTQFSNDLNLHI